MRRALICLTLVVAGCSSGSGNFVVVGVHSVPSGTTSLQVRSALDGQPAQALDPFAQPSGGFGSDTSFALDLGRTTSGRLSISVEAWVGGCAAASRSADLKLAAEGGSTLDLTLDAIDPQDCTGNYEHLPEMVRVPGTRFAMGCNPSADANCVSDEEPQHAVTLSSFFIDRTEISAAAYRTCQTRAGCGAALLNQDPSAAAETFITWDDAQAYCQARGKRLPTEAEWELAARGTDGRIYPWGNDAPSCTLANFSPVAGRPCFDVNSFFVGPIDQFGGLSPYGALGMAGNVEEWVADWYATAYPAPPSTNPTGPTSGVQRVLRGGAWISSAAEIRASRRNHNAPDASAPPPSMLTPEANSSTMGIRCARTQ
jgi:formylglycine-generating enzyme required for sulfatase activity